MAADPSASGGSKATAMSGDSGAPMRDAGEYQRKNQYKSEFAPEKVALVERFAVRDHTKLEDDMNRYHGSEVLTPDQEVDRQAKFVEDYYAELTKNMPVEVKYISPRIGKGMFAKRDFAVGETVFVEDPLVGIQHIENVELIWACARCLRLLGPLEKFVQHLVKYDKTPTMVRPELLDYELATPVPCGNGCRDMYCSERCRDLEWKQHHSLLCMGANPTEHSPLVQFYLHADQTNEIFRMAAKCIATTIVRMRENGGDLDAAWKPFAIFRKDLWWDVSTPGEMAMTDEEFSDSLKFTLNQSRILLRDAIGDESTKSLFELNFYSQIIGMFEINNLSLFVPSPLAGYFDAISSLPAEESKAAKKKMEALMDDLNDCFLTDCEGTGIFPVQSTMNHSCDPNAEAMKKDGDLDGRCIIAACKPIKKGDEILCSYIDENDTYEARTQALLEYRFKCICPKCLEQAKYSTTVRINPLAGLERAAGARAGAQGDGDDQEDEEEGDSQSDEEEVLI